MNWMESRNTPNSYKDATIYYLKSNFVFHNLCTHWALPFLSDDSDVLAFMMLPHHRCTPVSCKVGITNVAGNKRLCVVWDEVLPTLDVFKVLRSTCSSNAPLLPATFVTSCLRWLLNKGYATGDQIRPRNHTTQRIDGEIRCQCFLSEFYRVLLICCCSPSQDKPLI